MWTQVFADSNKTYNRAAVVLFSTGTVSGCGNASSATGPFYCPADHKVYLDLSFFNELSQRFGAPGDFAAAYVIAHELGHHVQSVLGIEAKLRQRSRSDPSKANAYRWSSSSRPTASQACGPTRPTSAASSRKATSTRASRPRPRSATTASARGSPEQWTHGSSELRQKWFRTGFDSGNAGDCDTFDGVT